MKLLSLHIDKYKNLTGDYDFTTQDGYIALIGENGSGKSNLLEAISLIFGKLYKISNIEDKFFDEGCDILVRNNLALPLLDTHNRLGHLDFHIVLTLDLTTQTPMSLLLLACEVAGL